MRQPRIPVEGQVVAGACITLSSETAHHLLRVLRLRNGDPIRLFNGDPGDWLGTLRIHGKRDASVDISGFEPIERESPLRLHLVQGISRGQRMDYTLEKSVELGVHRITPVVMQRTQAPPRGDRMMRKYRHWCGVVSSASAQSGRTTLPTIDEPIDFRTWLADSHTDTHPHVLLDPHAERDLRQLPTATHPLHAITLLAGPEGGFAPDEREQAMAAGCIGITLGPRILRTETAAVAALAAMQTLYGDLGQHDPDANQP